MYVGVYYEEIANFCHMNVAKTKPQVSQDNRLEFAMMLQAAQAAKARSEKNV